MLDCTEKEAHEAELKRIQAALVPFGADPAVCEVARVLRLPGFWNMKRAPHVLVELASVHPARYTPEEILNVFPDPPGQGWSPRLVGGWDRGRDDRNKRAHAYAQVLARETPAISGADGHRTTFQVALEGLRHGNPPSDHIPEFSAVEEELADTIIRIMDFGFAHNYRVAEALVRKHEFNRTRPHMHGGKRF
jgi:hypothetical protein